MMILFMLGTKWNIFILLFYSVPFKSTFLGLWGMYFSALRGARGLWGMYFSALRGARGVWGYIPQHYAEPGGYGGCIPQGNL